MTVLVTGAGGFIGGHLVGFLREKGQMVRGLIQKGALPAVPVSDADQQGWVIADLKDPESLLCAAEGCDQVFHLAGLSRYDANVPEVEYLLVNVAGTLSLLEACRRHHVKRFIYVSSIEAVGLSPDGRPLTEESVPHPRNIYGRSKLEAERAVLSFGSRHGMETLVVRIATTYGPGEKMLFKRLFEPISKGLFALFGDGSALIEFSYVKNQVEGLWRLAGQGRAGEIYFLSDVRSYTYKEVVQEIGVQLGVRLRLVRLPLSLSWAAALVCEGLSRVIRFYPFYVRETGRPPFSRRTLDWAARSAIFCSTGKIKRELGYLPAYSLAEGLKETVRWYREQGWL